MRASTEDLLAGALALAYKYCDVPALRGAYARVAGDGGGLDLAGALAEAERLSAARSEKLRRGARLAQRLLADAVFGTVAMRNQLVGGQMLNALMEEARRTGYQKTLAEVLLERGVVEERLRQAITERQEELLDELLAKERTLAGAIDLEGDPPDTCALKLQMLLGELAAKLSFLSREDFEAALRAQERVEQGLPAEAEEAPAAAPLGLATGPPLPEPGAGADDPVKGYELIEQLGAGAMGSVLKARKRDTGEVVALKILKPELAGDREYVERFLREAKAVARLSHKNIIRAVQVGRSGDYYFFAMEFIHGQTVSDLIKAKGRLPERFALMVTRCIASALAHAWQHQIIHRDIKPDNIMITQDGQVKLTDLGLARTAKQDSTLTISGVVMGSPAYISPEQATGEKNLDTRSDIYALGASLYHMLSGDVPYDGETPLHVMLKHMNEPVPDVRKKAPQVSEATRLLIMKLMAKRPEQRFQAAQHVEAAAAAIEEALARGQVPPPIPASVLPPGARIAQQPRPQPGALTPGAAKPQPAATAAAPAAKAATSKRKALSPEKKKQKEIGERLRRMKGKKKRF